MCETQHLIHPVYSMGFVDIIMSFDTRTHAHTYIHTHTHTHTHTHKHTHTYTHTHRFQFPTILVFYENTAELLVGECDNFLCNTY